MRLTVPYDLQTDNKLRPYEVCNMCSAYMGGDFLKPGMPSSDELYKQANSPEMRKWVQEHIPASGWMDGFFKTGSANQIWAVIEKVLDDHLSPEFDCYFKGISGYKEIEKSIKVNQMPVMIGTSLTGAGHIILLVGIEEPYFVCHDPYGDATKGYKSGSGEFVRYSYNFLWPKVFKDRALFFRKA